MSHGPVPAPHRSEATADARMIRWLRWLLLLPGAWLAWVAAVLIGIFLQRGLESLCPAEQVVSGMCAAPWFDTAIRGVTGFSAGVAAVLILLTTTLLAPGHRPAVAAATFFIGSLAALAMAIRTGSWLELAAAIVAGGLTTAWLLRRERVRGSTAGRRQRIGDPR